MFELMELCGFDSATAKAQAPRVRAAFTRLGISDDDIARGKSRLTTYFDMDLAGVRKVFGVFLKDLTNIVLMREEGREKVVHACMAPVSEVMGTAIMDNSATVGLMNPNFTFHVMMGEVFGKMSPIFEAAERLWLRGGVVAHCGMVKTRLGLLSLGMLPRPDVTLTSGFMCEASPKANDMIEQIYGIPACHMDTCIDREWSEFPDSRRLTTLAAKSVRRAVRCMQEVTGFELTDDMLWRAIETRKPFGKALERVNGIISESDPVPLGSTHLNPLWSLGSIAFKSHEIAEVVDALDTLYAELVERAEKGIGALPKGAPRLLTILPAHHSDPRNEALVNEMGMVIVASDFQGTTEQGRGGAGVVDPADPYDVLAQHLHGSAPNHLCARIAIIVDMCKRLKVDGVLDRYHAGCRYGVGDAFLLKDAISKELGLPVLTYEWENFDPRVYNHEQFKAKLEVFKSMIDARRGGGGEGGG